MVTVALLSMKIVFAQLNRLSENELVYQDYLYLALGASHGSFLSYYFRPLLG